MRILLATGIFPPEIGGPAFYTQELAGDFSRRGIKVSVVTYGKNFKQSSNYQIIGVSRRWLFGLRQAIYLWKILRRAAGAEAILAFDSLGAGLPAVLAGKIFKKKVVIRIGGDFLWEKFIESGMGKETIFEFYQKKLHKRFPLESRLIDFVLQNASAVAFTTGFQKDLFVEYYSLNPSRALVITNIFEKKSASPSKYWENQKIILWTGRFIKLKNLDFLIRVFSRLVNLDNNLILELIGEGPELKNLQQTTNNLQLNERIKFISALGDKELFQEIEKSYFCVLPSLSEISPNFALRCLSFNKPIVLTQETGIKDQFPGLMYADPKSEDSFYQSMLRLLDANTYANYQKFIAGIRYKKTWQDLAEEYLQLLDIRHKT